jgi:BirA family biotin operon repressor/biotin-[acetyl-CoA-carboxylase] ligase
VPQSLQFTGTQLLEFNESDSTNVLAGQLLEDEPPEGTVIWARHQRAGRGQAGTRWLDAPGQNLTFSLIYYPVFLEAAEAFRLSKVAALGLREAVQQVLPAVPVQIKWPNDILVDKQKVAGILIENQLEGKQLRSSVIGMGLNVNQLHFPEELKARATSLKLHLGQDTEVEPLLWKILERLEKYYLQLRARDLRSIDQQYNTHLYGYQEEVSLEVDGEIGSWQILGLDPQGRLGATQGKQIRYFSMKEVRFVWEGSEG